MVIPKKHIINIESISSQDIELITEVFLTIKKIASQLDLEDGYRIVNNCGKNGGQSVKHLHFHVLAGRKMSWPPG